MLGFCHLLRLIVRARRVCRVERRGTRSALGSYGGEDCGENKQRRKGGCHHTTNHGTAERSSLISAIADSESHWNHPSKHCQRGHKDRTEPPGSALDRSFNRTRRRIRQFLSSELGK